MTPQSSLLLPGDPIPLDLITTSPPNQPTQRKQPTRVPGPGTHLHNSTLYASIAGYHSSTSSALNSADPKSRAVKVVHTISRRRPALNSAPNIEGGDAGRATKHDRDANRNEGEAAVRTDGARGAILPTLNSTVLSRITKISSRQASASILCVYSPSSTGTQTQIQPQPLPHPLPAIIRREDIRATEKDKISTPSSFQPCDVVKARIISIGDNGGGYYLSTAEDGLGVVMGWGEGVEGGRGEVWGGRVLAPGNWGEIRTLDVDGGGGRREARKVARPELVGV